LLTQLATNVNTVAHQDDLTDAWFLFLTSRAG